MVSNVISGADRRRDNAAELDDRPRLTYGWEDTTADPGGVFGDVLHVLPVKAATARGIPARDATLDPLQ